MHFLQLFVFGCFLVKCLYGQRIGKDLFHRREILDPDNRFQVDWIVDRSNNRISFNITVETRGWVLFGFANNASEGTGRDVVVGGVRRNAEAYLWDGNMGGANHEIVRDTSQDYRLDSGSILKNRYTFLSFSRNLDTCDSEDYPITENKVTLIWEFGEGDRELGGNYRITGRQQGSYNVYLLDPNDSLPSTDPLSGRGSAIPKTWVISTNTQLSRNHTTYLCSIHKAPRLNRKHHVIGFEVTFPDEISQQHVHHIIVTKCHAPRGTTTRALFEQYAKTGEKQTCLSWLRPSLERTMPMYFCSQVFASWGIGGRAYFIPENVGFPFGEKAEEYYLLQVHYDNADMLPNLSVSLHANLFYTADLRPHDGGVIQVGHDIPGLPTSLLIPPKSSGVRQFAHCAPECTEMMLPPEGITVVAGQHHTHYSGRQVRLRHFRGQRELPWVLYDDNFDPRFQQGRTLPQGPTKIYPGDQLTQECVHDNTWTNSTIVGGFSTDQEMCLVFLTHYSVISEFNFCRSDILSPEAVPRFLGVGNATWFESRLEWIATPPRTPAHLLGRTITEISNDFVNWDRETRKELQEFQEGHEHTGICARELFTREPAYIQQVLNTAYNQQRAAGTNQLVVTMNIPANVHTDDNFIGPVDYPRNAVPYRPPVSQCEQRRNTNFGWGH